MAVVGGERPGALMVRWNLEAHYFAFVYYNMHHLKVVRNEASIGSIS